MTDPLHDRLSAFGADAPVPALPGADAARTRGGQRRVRVRAGLAGTGAAVLLLAGAGAFTLLDGPGGTRSTLDIAAPSATPTPSSVASPPASPSPTPSAAGTPSPVLRASDAPSTTPSAAPSRSPSAAPRDLTGRVLTVADADRAEPGSWTREGFADEGPVLDPCPGGTRYPRDADRLSDATTLLRSTREAGGTEVAQQVGQYPSEAVARDAAAGYLRAVRGCAERTDDKAPGGPRTTRYEVLRTTTVGGAATSYLKRSVTCDACVGAYTYYAVQQRGDLVSVLLAAHGEDGDPGVDTVEPFAREAAARLAP